MRLLHSKTMRLTEFMGDDNLPPYAILSHTWGKDEVTYQDMGSDSSDYEGKAGYAKIRFCCQQAAMESLEWVWVDTCCIDKSSSAELSEAINSMFRWYQRADICYAYLSDVYLPLDRKDVYVRLAKSRWFTRGWTLQELVAPADVVFYCKGWKRFGTKKQLCNLLVKITGIDWDTLQGEDLESVSVASRMSWAASRTTTRVEDMAYCLLGIFDINMPLLYGEGKKAFHRLQEEIMKVSSDQSIFAWNSDGRDIYLDKFIKDQKALKNAENQEDPSEVNREQTLRGLLANSPSDFKNSQDIIPIGRQKGTYNIPPVVYNRGIQITLSVLKCPEIDYDLGIIWCQNQSDPGFFVAIPVKEWAVGEWHGRLGTVVLVPKSTWGPLRDTLLVDIVKILHVKEETLTRKGLDGCLVIVEFPSLESGFRHTGTYWIPQSNYDHRTRIFRPRTGFRSPQLLLVFTGSEGVGFVVALGRLQESERGAEGGSGYTRAQLLKGAVPISFKTLLESFSTPNHGIGMHWRKNSLSLGNSKRHVQIGLDKEVTKGSVTERVTIRVVDRELPRRDFLGGRGKYGNYPPVTMSNRADL